MKKTKVKGVYLQLDVRWSKAYMVLTNVQRDLLWLFLQRRDIRGGKTVNNGAIIMTHDWVYKRLKRSKKAVDDAFYKLIEVGFIKVEKKGEGRDGHLYRILIASQGEDDSEARWRKYPNQNWKRKKKKQIVGKETRWKKGEVVKRHPTKVYNNGSLIG